MALTKNQVRAGGAYAKRFLAPFTDAGGWEWTLSFSLNPLLSEFQRLNFSLAEAVQDADGLDTWLNNRANCIKAALASLHFQIKNRGLSRDEFLNRMIDVQIEPGGAQRLHAAVTLAIAKAFAQSEFGRRHYPQK